MKAKIREYMADLRKQKRVPEQREFPKLGAFCSVQEYVEQYFQINKTSEYDLQGSAYISQYRNLSTDPVTL
jgi:hypothetical protein